MEDGRPYSARKIAAARSNSDGYSAPAHEPEGYVCNKRTEGGGTPDHADKDRLDKDELPIAGRPGRDDEAQAQDHGACDERYDDAEAIGEPAHQDAPNGEADHGRGIRQRRTTAADRELRLNSG